MDVKDIVIDPGQVAVLIWMYRRDAYNVAGVFETVQLAYDHAMKFIYPEDQADSFIDEDFKGFCIESRHVLRAAEAETIGTDNEDFYAHEEYYFNEKGEMRYALGNAGWQFGSALYISEEEAKKHEIF